MGMNMAVEFHDSELKSIRREGEITVLRLDIYVHSSAGCPGSDAGTGWAEDGEMRIGSARVEREPPVLPLRVLTGSIQISGDRFDNLLPLPFDRVGPVSICLSGIEGSFVATGDGIRLVRTGSARDVEPFPGR